MHTNTQTGPCYSIHVHIVLSRLWKGAVGLFKASACPTSPPGTHHLPKMCWPIGFVAWSKSNGATLFLNLAPVSSSLSHEGQLMQDIVYMLHTDPHVSALLAECWNGSTKTKHYQDYADRNEIASVEWSQQANECPKTSGMGSEIHDEMMKWLVKMSI